MLKYSHFRTARLCGLAACVAIAVVSTAAAQQRISDRATDTRLNSMSRPVLATPKSPAAPDVDNLEAVAMHYFPGTERKAPAPRIFRLTRDQHDATAKALFPKYELPSVKKFVARDPLQTNYEYADMLQINAANFGGLSGWIGEIVKAVRANPTGVIACPAAQPPPEDCLQREAKAFVTRAFRGDAADAKIGKVVAFFLASARQNPLPQAAAELTEITLNSPDFLFRKEIDGNPRSPAARAEHLQNLTYTLADTPPDAFRSQQSSASAPSADVNIFQILNSAPAHEKLMRFFGAWLEIKEPDEFTISPAAYPEFNPKLAASMLRQSDQFLRARVVDTKFAPTLKSITQVPATSASSGDLGLFSLPAVIASHSGPTSTRLVKRGVFWAKKVMCVQMEPPPKDLHIDVDDLEGITERQKIEQVTRRTACAGCHRAINPLGFFQENYDALGRWREQDNGQAIDASVLIDFLDDGHGKFAAPVKTSTPADALKVLTGSTMFKQCFVRQLFRFYMGRSEEPSDDPILRNMFLAFTRSDSQDIQKALAALVQSDRVAPVD